jgi:diguanylate cyclase (GGDEF)-like protein
MASSHGRSLRARLYLLVFAAVIPATAAVALHAVQDRQSGLRQAEYELQQLALTLARDYQFLATSEHDKKPFDLPVRMEALRGERAALQKVSVPRNILAGKSADVAARAPSDAPATTVSTSDFVLLDQVAARINLPAGVQAMLINANGGIFSNRSNDSAVDTAYLGFVTARDANVKSSGGVARARALDGTALLLGFAPLPGYADTHVMVSMPLSNAYAQANRRLGWNVSVTVAVTLLLLLTLRWLGTRWLLQPLDSLIRTVERFHRGDLSARAALPHADAEIGLLARGFDAIADRVEHQVLERRRSEEHIRRLHRGYMLFRRVNHTIVHQRERAALLRELCRILIEEGGFVLAWVGWTDGAKQSAQMIAYHGAERNVLDRLTTHADIGLHPGVGAIQEERVVVCNDLGKAPHAEPWRQIACTQMHRAWAAFPLRMQGRVVGALNLHSADADVFNIEEQRLLAEVASDVSFALDTILHETQRREAEKRLTFMAYHDSVTELPNLMYYDELMTALRERARASARPFALMILGIERLQEVTATFGYHVEAELLRLIAQRLGQCVRVGDILARGAGNNFNVVFPDTDVELAVRSAHYVLKIMEQPFAIQGIDIELGVTIGIALFPDHALEPDALNRCAYTALAQARKTGSGHVLYSPGQESFSPERLALVSELRNAIENDHLSLVYQPKIDLASGDVAAVEALVRWKHPLRGNIPPDQFIPVAEQTGLIRSLTDWVIETATKQSHYLSRAEYRLPIAINLSTLNLLDPHLPARLYNHCLAWSVDPQSIELEITESALMQDPSGTLQVLQRLSETGYLLYIDDFGTGYSSLGYLKKLAVDALKIDKSFVLDMLQDRDAHQIVRSTIDLAHDLGLKVVAEGVETQETLARLRSLGCDLVQGEHIAPPMEGDKLLKWLATTTWHARTANTRVLPRGGKTNAPPRKGTRKKIL